MKRSHGAFIALLGLLVLSWLSAGTLGQSAPAPQGDPPVAGTDFQVAYTSAVEQMPAIAYNSATGVAVLVGGALACAVAYRLMVAIGRLPEDERLLR